MQVWQLITAILYGVVIGQLLMLFIFVLVEAAV